LDEAVRLWRERPERRGVALALLAESDPYDNGSVRWAELPQRLGGKIGAEEFVAFLGASPRSMARAAILWPALSAGWSRADGIVARLDKWLDDATANAERPQDPMRSVVAIVRRLCDENGRADLAKLGSALENRQRTHPGESWTATLDDIKRCSAAPAARPPPARPAVPTGRGAPIGPPAPKKSTPMAL
jgi:hypothetical protein